MKTRKGIKIMKKKQTMITIMIILIFITLSGCTDNTSINNNSKNIIGKWYKEIKFENITYKVIYKFFSNSSFFSGVWDSNSSSYSSSVNGIYELKNEKIILNVTGENPSVSTLKYSISEDNNNLILYYEDEENYDVYIREIQNEY